MTATNDSRPLFALVSEPAFIYFDAAGTLLFPEPSVGEVYAAIGQRFGSRRTANELMERFRTAFHRQEALDAAIRWRTSEARELARWRDIVAEALDDTRAAEECFQALYQHYALPEAWLCPPDTAAVLEELAARGYGLGLASNFDQRLFNIVAGKPELQRIGPVLISAEAGWSKPSPAFFAEAALRANLSPDQILFVGDELRNDYEGARTAGFAALLFDPHSRCPRSTVERITKLTDLLASCPPRR